MIEKLSTTNEAVPNTAPINYVTKLQEQEINRTTYYFGPGDNYRSLYVVINHSKLYALRIDEPSNYNKKSPYKGTSTVVINREPIEKSECKKDSDISTTGLGYFTIRVRKNGQILNNTNSYADPYCFGININNKMILNLRWQDFYFSTLPDGNYRSIIFGQNSRGQGPDNSTNNEYSKLFSDGKAFIYYGSSWYAPGGSNVVTSFQSLKNWDSGSHISFRNASGSNGYGKVIFADVKYVDNPLGVENGKVYFLLAESKLTEEDADKKTSPSNPWDYSSTSYYGTGRKENWSNDNLSNLEESPKRGHLNAGYFSDNAMFASCFSPMAISPIVPTMKELISMGKDKVYG